MYYIYEIIDHEEHPIYVGQTLDLERRMNEHRWAATCASVRDYKKYLYKKIRKLIREHEYTFMYRVICEVPTSEEAYQRERAQIAQRRREGIRLCNLTDGGEGTPGKKPVFTNEWRQRLSEAAKRRVERNPEGVRKASLAAKNPDSEKKRKEGYRKALEAAGGGFNKGKRLNVSEAHREALCAGAKQRFTGKPKSPEQKEKMRQAALRRWHPEKEPT